MERKIEPKAKEVHSGESVILHDLGKGALAGLAASTAVALLFFLKSFFRLVPQFDFIGSLGTLSGSTWDGAGWLILIGAGIIMGLGFALLDARIEIHPGTDEPIRGVLYGFLLWLVLMVTLMPLIGGGFFAMAFGIGASVIMLVAGILFGWVVGAAYGAMNPENLSDV